MTTAARQGDVLLAKKYCTFLRTLMFVPCHFRLWLSEESDESKFLLTMKGVGMSV